MTKNNKIMKDKTLSYQGNCTSDEIIEYLFGDVTNFAQLIEDHGDEFILQVLVVKYDSEDDIHYFFYKNPNQVKELNGNITNAKNKF